MFSWAWVLVPAPLMPEVAFVELPPRKLFLSKTKTLPPRSKTVCAADRPDRPPPRTMTKLMAPRERDETHTVSPKTQQSRRGPKCQPCGRPVALSPLHLGAAGPQSHLRPR